MPKGVKATSSQEQSKRKHGEFKFNKNAHDSLSKIKTKH